MTRSDASHCVLALWKWAEDIEDATLAKDMLERADRIAEELDVDTDALREMMRLCRPH